MKEMKRGFTLIEMLIVVGVFGVIIAIGGGLFFSTLTGSTKSRIMEIVRQNGDYVISVIERMTRNARSLKTYSGSSITIVNPDGKETVFSCVDNKIASNGATLMTNEVKIDNCSSVFTVTPGETGSKPAVVVISFSLSQAGVTTRPEEKAAAKFETTVSLRNY